MKAIGMELTNTRQIRPNHSGHNLILSAMVAQTLKSPHEEN